MTNLSCSALLNLSIHPTETQMEPQTLNNILLYSLENVTNTTSTGATGTICSTASSTSSHTSHAGSIVAGVIGGLVSILSLIALFTYIWRMHSRQRYQSLVSKARARSLGTSKVLSKLGESWVMRADKIEGTSVSGATPLMSEGFNIPSKRYYVHLRLY